LTYIAVLGRQAWGATSAAEINPHFNLLNQRITDEKDISFWLHTEQISSK
jgi:hypothetical protein